MALAFPMRRIVVFLHLEMSSDCDSDTSISIGAAGSSKFSWHRCQRLELVTPVLVELTIYHLLPSSSFLPSFLTDALLFERILSGFGLVSGLGLLRPTLSELVLRSGTLPLARNDGFLCVIWFRSTFFKPAVTASPLFNWSNTAPMSPPVALGAGADGGAGKASRPGRGGGGGGGGGPPAAPGAGGGGGGGGAVAFVLFTAGAESPCFNASASSMPCGFHETPVA